MGQRRWSLSQGRGQSLHPGMGRQEGPSRRMMYLSGKRQHLPPGMIVGAFNKETRGGAGVLRHKPAGDMNVLQPQRHQEGTQTRWATWKGWGGWWVCLDPSHLCGPRWSNPAGSQRTPGWCLQDDPWGSGQGLRRTSGISPGKGSYFQSLRRGHAIHPVNQHSREGEAEE